MALISEGNRLCDILVGESDIHNRYSRDTVTIATGNNLQVGAVVGKVTASGEFAEIDFAATNGTENAAGIVIDNYDATAAAVKGVILARDAVVREEALVWPTGATAPQIAGALAQLADIGIITRESV